VLLPAVSYFGQRRCRPAIPSGILPELLQWPAGAGPPWPVLAVIGLTKAGRGLARDSRWRPLGLTSGEEGCYGSSPTGFAGTSCRRGLDVGILIRSLPRLATTSGSGDVPLVARESLESCVITPCRTGGGLGVGMAAFGSSTSRCGGHGATGTACPSLIGGWRLSRRARRPVIPGGSGAGCCFAERGRFAYREAPTRAIPLSAYGPGWRE